MKPINAREAHQKMDLEAD